MSRIALAEDLSEKARKVLESLADSGSSEEFAVADVLNDAAASDHQMASDQSLVTCAQVIREAAEHMIEQLTPIGSNTLTRQIEVYRLWSSSGGDSGYWDTDFLQIPAATPDDKMDAAVQKASAQIPWSDGPPVLVGVYSVPDYEEEEVSR